MPEYEEMKMKFDKKTIGESFLKTLKNSNFLVMKCYNLVFNLKNIKKNIGMIIMTIILIISITVKTLIVPPSLQCKKDFWLGELLKMQ